MVLAGFFKHNFCALGLGATFFYMFLEPFHEIDVYPSLSHTEKAGQWLQTIAWKSCPPKRRARSETESVPRQHVLSWPTADNPTDRIQLVGDL